MMNNNLQRFLLWEDIMENVEDAAELFNIRREVLPKSNPFDLSDEKFVKLFRLTKPLCENLIDMVRPYINGPTRISALIVETKVLAAVRFFGHGSYQEITGSNNYIGISQPSMSRCIKEVCSALNQSQILNNWVHFPRNIVEIQALRTSYFQKHQFPGIIGCVDCTHVSIIAPPTDDPEFPENIYVNRKNYHSINVQLICDSNLKIMNVNAQFPGSTHDANIWRHSEVSTIMETIYRRDPQNVFFLLGDSGYPTRPWLLTPIPNPAEGPEQRFNDRLCSIRATIERCNGVLKNRFRCLLKHRVLHYSPTVAGQIINSCCVLRNMCIANNVPEPEEPENEEIDYGLYVVENVPNENIGRVNPDLAAARILQQNIINNHFR